MIKAAGSIVLAICCFWPLAAWIYSGNEPAVAKQARMAHMFVTPENCLPEPGERKAFLAGLVVVPALMVGFFFALDCAESLVGPRVPFTFRLSLDLGLGVLFILFFCYAVRGEAFFQGQAKSRIPLALLLPIGLLAWAGRRLNGCDRVSRYAAHLIVLVVLGVIVVASLIGGRCEYAGRPHFTAVFGPMVQVRLGKAILVDSVNQYGLYPHFLDPLFSVIGLSVLKFTALMGLLTAGSFGLLWLVLSREIADMRVALVGFLALALNGWCLFIQKTYEASSLHRLDMYYQYYPIRVFFPASAVMLSWLYLRFPRRWLYWATMAFLSAGILWNLDSGIPALGAWVCALGYAELFEPGWVSRLRRLACHCLAAATAMTVTVCVYMAAIYVAHATLPDFRHLVTHQRLYYLSGYMMLPMKLPGVWMLVILIYLAGLGYATHALFCGRRKDSRATLILALSVLGAGLFPYYQGRSHPMVLILVWWPCFPLLALFLDELVLRLKVGSHRPIHWITAVLLWWLLGGSTAMVLATSGGFWRVVRETFPVAVRSANTTDPEAALLTDFVPPGAEVLVVSDREALLHLASGIPSISPCPLNQLALVEDYRDLIRRMEGKHEAWILVDEGIHDTWVLNPSQNAGVQLVLEMIHNKCYRIATAGKCSLYRLSDDLATAVRRN